MPNVTMRLTLDGPEPIAFIDAELDDQGDCGLVPYGRNVIVKMDEVATQSPGGLIYADPTSTRLNHASSSGCIVAMGSEAFTRHENGHAWTGPRPQIGDRIEVVIYSGKVAGSRDGHTYRIMDQNCIIAGIAA